MSESGLVASCVAISSHSKSWAVQDVSAHMPENLQINKVCI